MTEITGRSRRRFASFSPTALAVGGCLLIGGCGTAGGPAGSAHPRVRAVSLAPASARPSRPNIVLVLTDDLTANLLRFMPHVQALERSGASFGRYFVADSLCCPSRASIFTGRLPHNTGVLTNSGAYGGVSAFHRRGDESRTFAVALQRAGYLTALMGKYLNGYLQAAGARADGSPSDVPARYVPPGWSGWDVAGWGYNEFGYELNQSGVLRRFGRSPRDYLTDVIAREGVRFIETAVGRRRPFLLELATFAPHAPSTPAPRNARDFPGLRAPRPANFDALPSDPPGWLRARPPLRPRQLRMLDRAFRSRARSVEAVDRMLATIEATLRNKGIAGDTYIFFSSDNGFHIGEYRLMPGKGTAFDTDVRVPLIVSGPGVGAGTVLPQLTANIDLAPTFAAIAGVHLDGDGHSLLALLHGEQVRSWRNAVLIEHHPSVKGAGDDPDAQPPASGSPGAYHAIRTAGFLYVEHAGGEVEFYDLTRDPFELHNIARRLDRRALLQLHHELLALRRCHGPGSCWRRMHLPPLAGGQ